MNKMHFYRPMMTGSIPTSTQSKTTSIPASNISKSQKGYNLEIAVPGFSKEELEIILEEDNLKIIGKYEVEKETKEQFIHKDLPSNHLKLVSNYQTQLIMKTLMLKLKMDCSE